jgi:hypothetical protein
LINWKQNPELKEKFLIRDKAAALKPLKVSVDNAEKDQIVYTTSDNLLEQRFNRLEENLLPTDSEELLKVVPR